MQQIALAKLRPYPKNAKRHDKKQIKQIADSIREFGFNQPIVVDKNNEIIVGHGRWLAAQELGLKTVPIIQLKNLTDDQVKAYRLADNKLNESEWEMGLAIEELKELDLKGFDITLTGFDKDLLIEPSEQDDAAPENAPPVVKLGDVWALGRHTLMCGDSTKREDVEKLMGGVKADMVFTDPPYGKLKMMNARKKVVARVGKYKEYIGHGNFDFKFCWELIKSWECKKVIWGGNYFANYLPITTSWIVWDKRAGEHSYFSDCELAWSNLGRCAKVYSIIWQGMIRQGENSKRVHPTQKPVELAVKILDGDIILDLFGGSGSTLIACEKTNRICKMMELDEKYCDVILKRYEDYTGQKAEKIG